MGFFRDLSESKLPENPDQEGEDVTIDAEAKEEEAMSDLEDANVDKDILNQILGDEGGETEVDVLTEDVSSATEDTTGSSGADVAVGAEESEAKETLNSEIPIEDTTEKRKQEWEAAPLGDIPDNDVTVITKGTTINGGIASDGSLEIMGTITGDVECLGKVSVYGTISGNVSAADVVIKTRRLEGNIKSDGSVEVVQGTIVIGDIEGTSAVIAGAVNGNIDVNGPVTVDATAIVKGSIKAKSIQVNTGAVLDGYCSLNYAGVNLEDFFSDN